MECNYHSFEVVEALEMQQKTSFLRTFHLLVVIMLSGVLLLRTAYYLKKKKIKQVISRNGFNFLFWS